MFNRNKKLINSYNYENIDYMIWDYSFKGKVKSVRTLLIRFVSSSGFDIFILTTVNKLIIFLIIFIIF